MWIHLATVVCFLTASVSCQSCSYGYFSHKGRCSPCQQNCAECMWANICKSCKTGYFLLGSSCRPCPPYCESCSMTTSSTCDTCKVGYYGIGCTISCSEGCNHWHCYKTNGHCRFGCLKGYYGDSCSRCLGICRTCSSATSCTTCRTGFYGRMCNQPCRNCRNNTCSLNGHCLEGCIDGYQQGTTGCIMCPDNCSKCTSDSVCDQCKPGYFGTKCYQCRENCSTCASASVCHACKPGHYGTSCQYHCSGTCFKCGDVIKTCDGNCSDCIDGCSKDTGECFRCLDGYYKTGGHCQSYQSGCAECLDLNNCTTCRHGYGFVQETAECVKVAGDGETVPGFDVFRSIVIPVVCVLVGILLTMSVRCIVVRWKRRNTVGDPPPQGALYVTAKSDTTPDNTYAEVYPTGDLTDTPAQGAIYITAQSDATPINMYAEVYPAGDLTNTPTQGAIYITAQSDATPNNMYAEVYPVGDLTDTPPQGAIYITAQSDATPSNMYAEVYPVGDLKDTPTGPSQAGKTSTWLRTTDECTPGSDNEPNRLYASIDETDTEAGAPCHKDQLPHLLNPGVGTSSEGGDQLPRLLNPGVGTSSEGGDQLPRSLPPNPPATLPRRAAASPMATLDTQYEILRKNGESTNVYSPLNQTDVPPNSSGPSDSLPEGGVGASSEVDPVYWLPAGEYEALRTRQTTSDTYTSLQAADIKI